MSRSVDEAFDTFLTWLTPTSTETQAAASHRASIEQCLKTNFSMQRFFRSGSFGFGTSVSSYSDVDYFAVVPPARLHSQSALSLQSFANALRARFPFTNITIDAPAVVIPFGSQRSERHEIIPAHDIQRIGVHDMFGIPDRHGGWMKSSPDASAATIDRQNFNLGGKAKNLIRLLKAWKYYAAVPLRSFYVELIATEYMATQSILIYPLDVQLMLDYMYRTNLSNLVDPATGDTVAACDPSDKLSVLVAIDRAKRLVAYANSENDKKNVASAFQFWNRFYSGNFVGYY
jgi:hypothetical protein